MRASVNISSLFVWDFPGKSWILGKLGQGVTLLLSHPHPRNFNYEGSGVKNKSDSMLALTVIQGILFLPFPYRSDTGNRPGCYQDCCYSAPHSSPALPSSWKVLPLPPPLPLHTPTDPIHPSVPAEITFSRWNLPQSLQLNVISPAERYNSAYCLCTHVVYINSYFRIRKSLREIIGNLEIYSFMCNSFILSFVCNWAPSIALDTGGSKMNQVLSLWSPPLAWWGGQLRKSLQHSTACWVWKRLSTGASTEWKCCVYKAL